MTTIEEKQKENKIIKHILQTNNTFKIKINNNKTRKTTPTDHPQDGQNSRTLARKPASSPNSSDTSTSRSSIRQTTSENY
jgi:outer membrane protein assembly factor BamE (lipoprotein component of BamABCDE complex)